jgi:hypothetical protein
MVYSFARISVALAMRAEDVFVQSQRPWARLHEKGGKRDETPCHHNLVNRPPRPSLARSIRGGRESGDHCSYGPPVLRPMPYILQQD